MLFSFNMKDEIYSSSRLMFNLVSAAFRNPVVMMSGVIFEVRLQCFDKKCVSYEFAGLV